LKSVCIVDLLAGVDVARPEDRPPARHPSPEAFGPKPRSWPEVHHRRAGRHLGDPAADPTIVAMPPRHRAGRARPTAEETHMQLSHPGTFARAGVAASERLAGVLLFALAAQFMTVIMLAASIAPGYDLPGGAISDLGAIPETRLLFNTSLVAVGVLNLLAGAVLSRLHPGRRIVGLFTLAGVGALGAGCFRSTAGDRTACSPWSRSSPSTSRRSRSRPSCPAPCGPSPCSPGRSASSSWS
jgi:hypothetical protein